MSTCLVHLSKRAGMKGECLFFLLKTSVNNVRAFPQLNKDYDLPWKMIYLSHVQNLFSRVPQQYISALWSLIFRKKTNMNDAKDDESMIQ